MAVYSVPVVHPGTEYERELWSGLSKPFSSTTTITGTTLLSVWSPSGKKFVLKGYSVTAVVRTAFAGSNPVILQWFDNANSAFICDAGMAFEASAVAGVSYSTGYVWLREGIISATAGNVLKLGFAETISTGVLSVAGVALGEEL